MLKRSLPIEIRPVSVELPGVASEAVVDFISDLHIRGQRDLDEFEEAFARMSRSTVLMAGDYVEKKDLVEPFLRIVGMGGRRIIGVFGNNDLRFRSELRRSGERHGVRFLEDEEDRFDGVSVFGLRHRRKDRFWLRDPYPASAFPTAPSVILAHTPDALLALPSDRSFAFLAGHVHGGQVRFPWLRRWWTHTRIGRAHAEGHSRRGMNRVFVGRGIGCSLLELRNVPRELYELTFVPAVV